jgi:hypothetical protein
VRRDRVDPSSGVSRAHSVVMPAPTSSCGGRGAPAEGVLEADRASALEAGLAGLPPQRQRLLALLVTDPPPPSTEVGTRLGDVHTQPDGTAAGPQHARHSRLVVVLAPIFTQRVRP